MRSIALYTLAALALAGLAVQGGAATAQPADPIATGTVGARAAYNQPPPVSGRTERNLGGGFIEMLLTGRDPTPRARGVRPSQTAAPMSATEHRARTRALERQVRGGPAQVIPAEIPPLTSRPVQREVAALDQHAPAAPRRSVAQNHAIAPEYRRQTVAYDGRHAPGTIIVDTGNRFLYLVQPGGKAIRYGVGVGREGFSWKGTERVSRKAEWPSWRPPAQMLRRQPDLPRYMAGGPENPLGARALYLGSTLYRIHGTNEPHTIGQAMSSGCIRMLNEDVIDLYERVSVGSRVVVM